VADPQGERVRNGEVLPKTQEGLRLVSREAVHEDPVLLNRR